MHLRVDDYLAFVDITLDGYRRAIDRLDDDTVNARPDVVGANSPYALVTHATAACRWWLLHIVLGQPTDRMRDHEFEATGMVADLRVLVDELSADLHAVSAELGRATELANDPGRGPEWSVGTVAMHAYEELAQHLGHLELTVDLVAN